MACNVSLQLLSGGSLVDVEIDWDTMYNTSYFTGCDEIQLQSVWNYTQIYANDPQILKRDPIGAYAHYLAYTFNRYI